MRPLLLSNKRFYIPAGIVVNGTFVSEKDGGIEGTINGDVRVTADLTVEKKGIINGDLHVKDITVKGHVNGNIYCEGKVTVLKDAFVSGNIFAAESRVEKLSIVKGVISHFNLYKKEAGNFIAGTDTIVVGPETAGISTYLAIPTVPADVFRDEPQQNWF